MPKTNLDDYTANNDFARIGDKEKHFGNRIIMPFLSLKRKNFNATKSTFTIG